MKLQYLSTSFVTKFSFTLAIIICSLVTTTNLSAQVNYSLSNLSGQTYNTLTGPAITVVNTTAGLTSTFGSGNQDDGGILINLPFNFTFNGNTFTKMSMCTNGWVAAGDWSTIDATNDRTGSNLFTSGIPNNTFGAWFKDMGANFPLGNGSMRYGLIGTDVYAFQWDNAVGSGFSDGSAVTISFQVNIYGPASTNPSRVDIIYGPTVGTIATAADLGIEDAIGGTGHFINALNGSTTVTSTSTVWPGNGNGYRFDPFPPCATPTTQPTALNLTPNGVASINGSFTPASPLPTSYLIVRTPTNVAPVPVNNTIYAVGSSAIGYIEAAGTLTPTFSSTGLTGGTTYYYWIFSYNNTVGACTGPTYLTTAPLTGSATTTNCSIGGTKTIPGSYPSLTAAITDMQLNGVAGPVVLELQPGYVGAGETYPIVLPNITCASAVNTLTIRPAAGATGLSITSANATGTININGGSFWTIDGRPGGVGTTRDLTIANTNTSGYAIQLVNDASTNLVEYCQVKSVNTSTTSGTILIAGTTGVNGNDNNTIDNCNIGDGATTPTMAIYALGSTTTTLAYNDNDNITNCSIFNYFSATANSTGIKIDVGNSAWTISNNSLYQTVARTVTTAAVVHRVFWITPNTGNLTPQASGFIISNNSIGGNSSTNAGTYTITSTTTAQFLGMDVSVGDGLATSIQNNTIKNINFTTTSTSNPMFAGISSVNGNVNVGTIAGNTIGSATTNGSILITNTSSSTGVSWGIRINGPGVATTLNCQNNTVAGITIVGTATVQTGFIALGSTAGSSHTQTFINNTIGSTTLSNSINLSSAGTGTGSVTGISATGGSPVSTTITGNTIANLNNASTGTSTAQTVGIVLATGIPTITNNIIRNLTNATAQTGNGTSTAIMGINMSSTSAGCTISGNTLSSFTLTSASITAATQITGLSFSGASTGTNIVSKNFIHSFDVTAVNPATTMTAMDIGGGATNFVNNMIRLGIRPDGTSFTNPSIVRGMSINSGSANNFWFNSVYIGGTGVGTNANNTFAFNRTTTSGVHDVRDNIFINNRSNATTGGIHYAIKLASSTTVFPTFNFNVYQYAGTGGKFANNGTADVPAWFPGWSGNDNSSAVGDPKFVAPTGTASTVDLHIQTGPPTPVEASGVDVGVLDDFDSQTRASLTPVDIGADAGNFVLGDLSAPLITYTPLLYTCSNGNRTLTATITDNTGVPTSGTLTPRIYYKKNNGTYFSSQGVLATGTGNNGTWTFTIVASDMGGLNTGDVVSYFVIAQDLASPSNIGSTPAAGLVATDVNTVTTPPTTPNTYSINVNLSGSYNVGAGQTYPTLNAAITSYNSACISGPVTFSLTDAAYVTTSDTIKVNPTASVTNTLTIKPTLANTTITGNSSAAVLVILGADYVTINGSIGSTVNSVCPVAVASRDLTYSNTNAGTSSAVIWMATTSGLDGATNNTITNCNVVGNSNTTTLFGIGSGGTSISTSSLGTGNNNNSFINNNISKTQYAIYSQGASITTKNTGTVINQNLVNTASPNNVQFNGVFVGFEDGIQINANNISGLSTANTLSAITVGLTPTSLSATTTTGNEVTNATITKNVIGSVTSTSATGFSSTGIAVASAASGTNLIANNMVSGVNALSTASDISAGIYIGGGNGITKIYHNTVSMSGTRGAASYPSYALAINGASPIVDIRNNIFYNSQTSTGAGQSYAIGLAYTSVSGNYANMTSNNNDFDTSGTSGAFAKVGNLAQGSGTNKTTLAAWQAETGKDAASKMVVPAFVSLSNLHLDAGNGSNFANLHQAGTSGTGITDDVDCDVRNATTPDIGADEYTPLTGLDVGATGLVNPAIGVCYGNAEPIIVSIKNYSLTPIDLSVNVVKVAVNVTGPTNYTNTIRLNSGIIAAGGTITVTMALPIDMSQGGTYSYTITTILNGDLVSTNDAVSVSRTNLPLGGSYNVGVGGNYTTITAAISDYNNATCISSPVVFNLTDPSYAAGETFPIIINYNPVAGSNTITIKPAAGQTTTVTGNIGSGALIKLNGARNIIIDGSNNGSNTRNLDIINTTTTSSGNAVIWMACPAVGSGSVNNTIKNTIIEGNSSTTSFMGMYVGGNTASGISLTASGSDLNNFNTISNNLFRKTQYGLVMFGFNQGTPDTNNVVSNNNFGTPLTGEGFNIEGLHTDRQKNLLVSGNEIQNVRGNGTTAMFGMRLLDFKNGQAFNNVIHNLSYTGTSTTALVGLTVLSSSYTLAANPSQAILYNNVLYDITSTGTSSTWNTTGILLNQGYGDRLYFNSVHMAGQIGNGSGPSAAFANGNASSTTPGTVPDIRDNIFNVAGSTAAAASMYAYYSKSTTLTGTTQNYNLFRSAGTGGTNNTVNFNGTSYTFAAWQTFAAPIDANSISVDPLFNSNINLHPQVGSPVLAAGVAIPGINFDAVGAVRNPNPSMGAYENGGDFAPPVITYTPFTNTCAPGDRTVTATITDFTGIPTTGALIPRIYYKKNNGAYFSQPGSFVLGTANSGTWNFTIVASDLGGLSIGDNVSYFIVAQDLVSPPNVGSNPTGAVGTSVNAITTFPTPNTYAVQTSLGGSYSIGVGGNYTTLTAAAAAYNTACLTSPVVFNLTDATYPSETYPIVLNANSFSSSTNTLTIKPAAGINTTISGSVATGALVRFDGADNIIIDGSNNGTSGRNLDIINTNTSTTGNAVIWMAAPTLGNGSLNNTIKNCIIEGNASTTTFVGLFVGGNTTSGINLTAQGADNNNFNTFSNNLFRKTQYGMAMFGYLAASPDSNNIISNNNFGTAVAGEGFQLEGIHTDREKNLIVSGNEVQNVKGTSLTNMFGIRLLDFKNGQAFKNVIHNLSYTGTSTTKIYGLELLSSTYSANTNPSQAIVYNNTVYDITSSGTSATWNTTGILASTGYGDRYYFNSVNLGGQIDNSSSGLSAAFANGDGNITTFCTNIDVRNNIFNITGSSLGGNVWAYYTKNTTFTGSIQSNNILHSAGTGATNNVGSFNGVNYTTLASWQTATGVDANSSSLDPLFNSNTNLQPQLGSPALGAGTPIPGISTDITGASRNPSTPTIGAFEIGSGDFAAPIIVYNLLGATCATGDRTLSATITDGSGVPLSGSLVPRLYYSKNGGAYVSSAGVLTGGSGTNSTWTFTIAASSLGGLTSGDVVSYYVIAQDIQATPYIGSSPAGVVATDVNTVTTPPTPNTFAIQTSLPLGSYNVGAGYAFSTLSAAIVAYNTSCLNGPVVFNLKDASYTSATGSDTIKANPYASAINTLTIQVTQANTTYTGNSNAATLVIQAADYVTIDGSTAGTTNSVCPAVAASRDLTITNLNGGTSSAVVWLTSNGTDGATNNVIRNCNIVGTGSAATLFGIGSGGASIGTGSFGSGNNNNSFINNSVSATQYGIYSQGASIANKNTGTVINQNLINTASPNNVQYNGIYVGFEDGIQISGNNISNLTTTNTLSAIALGIAPTTSLQSATTGNEVTNATVSNNIVGSVISTSTTGWSASGILVASTASGTNLIYNNMVSGVLAPSTSGDLDAGIFIGGGAGTTKIYYNTVSMSGSRGTASYSSYALAINGSSPIVDIRNNILVNSQTSSSSGQSYAIGLGYTTAPAGNYLNLLSNNNDLDTSGSSGVLGKVGSLAQGSGTNEGTLALWRTETGRDAASVSVLPTFLSATDLHLNPSASSNATLNGAATPLAAVTTDIDCQARNGVTPDIGADEFVYNCTTNALAGVAGSGSICTNELVEQTNKFVDQSCNLIANVAPAGASPVTGNVNACVKVETEIPLDGLGNPYVQRHYDILPAVNAAASTANVTLYYTQAEFDAYNTFVTGNNLALPLLPTGGADNGNVRVAEFHGAGSLGTYPGVASLIIPTSVVWSAANNWWAVTLPVTGFGGFFVQTGATIIQPGVCPSSTTQFVSNVSGSTYQWQVDNGTGYVNLNNNSVYSGTNSSTLVITNPPTNFNANKYRAVINGGPTTGAVFTLKIIAVWQGTVSTDWTNAANWSCNLVPDQYVDVQINASVPNAPTIGSNVSCRSVTLKPNATLIVAPGVNLDIKGH